MKIYKFRDLSSPNEDDFRRLEDSVHRFSGVVCEARHSK